MQGSTKQNKAVKNKTALHTLLMMTAEFMLSKRPVLRFTAALFFLLQLFLSHIYCINSICSLEKMERATNEFLPFKTPRPDGIYIPGAFAKRLE